MQQRYLASAITAGLFALSGTATADVDVYGQAHLAISHLDDGADYSALNFSSNASRLGFRAGHDLSPDLRGLIQIEGQVNFDNEGAERFTSRDSFAGLEGNWGLIRAGRFDTPHKVVRGRVDLFGNQIGDTRNLVRGNYTLDGETLQGFDERFRTGVAYRSPQLHGFHVDLHYSFDTESDGNAADSNDDDAWSASLSYQAGPAFAAVSHERWNAEAAGDRDMTRLAGYYDIGDLRVTGFAQTASDPDDDAYGVGTRFVLTPRVHLKAQYYWLDADADDLDADLLAAGVNYLYADNLTFYLNYAQMDNDDLQDRQPWNEASTLSRTGATGETARSTAVGMIYNF